MSFFKKLKRFAGCESGKLLSEHILIDDIEKVIITKRRFVAGDRIIQTEDFENFAFGHHVATESESPQPDRWVCLPSPTEFRQWRDFYLKQAKHRTKTSINVCLSNQKKGGDPS